MQQGFEMAMGAGMLKRNRGAYIVGMYGKMLVLEYSDAENQVNAPGRLSNISLLLSQWGGLVTPEVKGESFVVDNRGALEATKGGVGKCAVAGLGREVGG